MYRYYSTERKALEVTVPYGAAALHNYGANGAGFDRLGRVWGYADYEKELTAEQAAKYQLTPAGQSPTYYPISEETACRAKKAISFSDYIQGSATEDYRLMVDKAAYMAYRHKQKVDPMFHAKIDRLLDLYSRKLAENRNKHYAIVASCPSILIAGGSNFPVRKKEKQNARDRANWEEYQQIQGLLSKIKSVGMGGISSDDPDALDKLRAKLDRLVQHQKLMKAANAAIRMKDTEAGDAKLELLGFDEHEIAQLREPDYCGRVGYPAYELSNNNANIHRIQERIKELEKRETEPAPDGWTFPGGEVVVNTEENRLQVFFGGKPEPSIREELKSNGFRWAPSQGAWQRQLTDNALRAAKGLSCLQPVEAVS